MRDKVKLIHGYYPTMVPDDDPPKPPVKPK